MLQKMLLISVGWNGGDPHFITMDGLSYTFNGRGEYSFLEYGDCKIQTRFAEINQNGMFCYPFLPTIKPIWILSDNSRQGSCSSRRAYTNCIRLFLNAFSYIDRKQGNNIMI